MRSPPTRGTALAIALVCVAGCGGSDSGADPTVSTAPAAITTRTSAEAHEIDPFVALLLTQPNVFSDEDVACVTERIDASSFSTSSNALVSCVAPAQLGYAFRVLMREYESDLEPVIADALGSVPDGDRDALRSCTVEQMGSLDDREYVAAFETSTDATSLGRHIAQRATSICVAATTGDLGVDAEVALERIASSMSAVDGVGRELTRFVSEALEFWAIGDPADAEVAAVASDDSGRLISVEVVTSDPPTPTQYAALEEVVLLLDGDTSHVGMSLAATNIDGVEVGTAFLCRGQAGGRIVALPRSIGCDGV
ncbi:hypothetical protein [Ilumatobacter sp.]|uniref:hypothetical protein n=1 Tax=Ilumatobacter sp. TaxID=1967498 RepID=UPI003AF4A544